MYFVYTKNHPIVLLLTPLIILGYLLAQALFLTNPPSLDLDLGWFGNYTLSSWIALALNTFVLSLNSILINWIFNKNEFLDKQSFVPSLIYITLIIFFESSVYLSGTTIAQTFLLLALAASYSLNQKEDERQKAFNIGLFVGISICLIPSYYPFIILAYIMLWTFRPFIVKEFVLLTAGILTPFLYALYLNLSIKKLTLEDTYIIQNENIYLTFIQYLPIGVSVLALLFAWTGFKARLQKINVRIRRIIRVQYFWILFGVFHIGVDLMFNGKFDNSVVLAIPLTFGLSLAATHKPLNRFTIPFLYIILLMTIFKFFNI